MVQNQALRDKIYVNRLRNWEVAQAVGIADSTFSKWLRKPLTDEQQKRVEKAISELTAVKQ
ncbi:hypothetical protein HC026_11995 [Lactobacillus sp. LC28-10]|uniref:HTH cro/C1-type domain-containing protein n=1 Tax=Secundilactobacillus angelensis TaxID=2722706 RepID=A0ABX1L152_9LACO|nr:hypothetical protein [Secundilactobacillus angelensis]MCH5463486.1 hypothetical protein [Secundilactobacillus angelensis]NLR19609.1 hypothetical protein [Secundilactobacillus angelensis]